MSSACENDPSSFSIFKDIVDRLLDYIRKNLAFDSRPETFLMEISKSNAQEWKNMSEQEKWKSILLWLNDGLKILREDKEIKLEQYYRIAFIEMYQARAKIEYKNSLIRHQKMS